MISFFVVGWTVHFWGKGYIWLLFLLGSGVWLLDVWKDAARAADLRPTSEYALPRAQAGLEGEALAEAEDLRR